MRRQSIDADQQALTNITNDLNMQSCDFQKGGQETVRSQSAATENNDKFHEEFGNPKETVSDDDMVDQEFRARFAAVQAADIEEVLNSIRTDPDYSITQEPSTFLDAASQQAQEPETKRGVVSSRMPLEAHQESITIDNPTYDQQYTFHQGSRGQSPPPGFEDASIPPYQDSSEVPAYQNVVSQPLGMSLSSSAHAGQSSGIISESQRPPMTDKFMLAHQARHGNSALSPLALLTPDQADMLPEYVLTNAAFDENDLLRGRTRSAHPAFGGEMNESERSKLDGDLAAVRDMEERDALEAIAAMESMRQSSAQEFSVDQLSAMLDAGDDPSDYYSAEELKQFQRLASDSASEKESNEAEAQEDDELRKIMSQFVRQSPGIDETAGSSNDLEESEELESMLRDRMLTRNSQATDRGSFARNYASSKVNLQDDQEVLAILAQAAQIADTGDNQRPVSQHANMFADSTTRTGIDVEALKDAALARKDLSTSSGETVAAPEQVQYFPGYGSGHGIKRTAIDSATYVAQQAKNAQKAQIYAELSADVLARRAQQDVSQESFDLTTKLLLINPEYYTIWNYRREIMLRGLFPHLDEVQKQDLLNTELKRLQGIQLAKQKLKDQILQG